MELDERVKHIIWIILLVIIQTYLIDLFVDTLLV